MTLSGREGCAVPRRTCTVLQASLLLFGVQQPPVSQSRATTSIHRRTMVYACRICPNVDKTVQRFGISKRSFEHHKVTGSQIVRVLLNNSSREQAGVMTDRAQNPTLVRRFGLLQSFSLRRTNCRSRNRDVKDGWYFISSHYIYCDLENRNYAYHYQLSSTLGVSARIG
jgi:hypothetical protein